MNALTQIEPAEAALVVALPTKEAEIEAIFIGEYEVTVAPLLAPIKRAVDAFKSSPPDPKTEKGRKTIASFNYKLARSRTTLDDAGKAVVTRLKELPRKIDANRRRARELIEAWQAEVTAPVDAWEAADTARKNRHLEGVTLLATLGANTEGRGAEELRTALSTVEAQTVDASTCEEFEEEYRLAKSRAVLRLLEAIAARERYDADQAELASLRARQAGRDAKDAEAARAREAEERFTRERRSAIAEISALAEVEDSGSGLIGRRIERVERMELLPAVWGGFLGEARLAYDTTLASLRRALGSAEAREAEQVELAARLEAEAGERRRLEAEAKARREADEAAAERDRIAEAKVRAEADAAAARAADEEHRRAFNREAVAALALLVPGGGAQGNVECAKTIIAAIVRGSVPHLKMEY